MMTFAAARSGSLKSESWSCHSRCSVSVSRRVSVPSSERRSSSSRISPWKPVCG
jgi:hypothetical protein